MLEISSINNEQNGPKEINQIIIFFFHPCCICDSCLNHNTYTTHNLLHASLFSFLFKITDVLLTQKYKSKIKRMQAICDSDLPPVDTSSNSSGRTKFPLQVESQIYLGEVTYHGWSILGIKGSTIR